MIVYKYTLDIKEGPQALSMPRDARVVYVANQAGELCLWALVDPEKPSESRLFYVVGTGHVLSSGVDIYVGSATFVGGELVWHVFELTHWRGEDDRSVETEGWG